jgi:20S proteasome alpha/beta subunit
MATSTRPYVRKPYTPEKPKQGIPKSMTIAVGFLCNNGKDLIIASDRQLTAEGAYKRYVKKLVSSGPELLFGYAGDPGLYAEARQKILGGLGILKPSDVSVDTIRETTESVLNQMELIHNTNQSYRPLYMFIGVNEIFTPPRLLVFNGQALHESEGGVEIIGCGDASLIHFLGSHLHSDDLTPEQGKALGAYLIKKATEHIDKTGGTIDVEHADGVGFQSVDKVEVDEGIREIETQEEFLFTWMMQTPFSP